MIATYKILRNVTPLAWDWNCEIAPLPKNMLHAIRDMFHTKICQVGVYIPNDLLLLVIQYLLPRLDDFTPGSGINCWDGWRTLRKINLGDEPGQEGLSDEEEERSYCDHDEGCHCWLFHLFED